MTKNSANLAIQWAQLGLTEKELLEKARWLGERRQLGGGCLEFFDLSGRLLALAGRDFSLISAVFLHAAVGLERALRVHYKAVDESFHAAGSSDPYSALFHQAHEDRLFTDATFREPFRLGEWAADYLETTPESHAEALSILVPELRNRYVHGRFILTPDFLPMALQLREIADCLKTTGTRSLLE